MAEIKLNLSGHHNSALDELGFVFPGVIHVSDLGSPKLPEQVCTFLKGWMGSGDVVTIAIPGMSLLATLCIMSIHGLTGQFPRVQTLIRQEDGTFAPGPCHDLQGIRNFISRRYREGTIEL